MRFNYQARTKIGKIQTGIVEASNREAAFNVLKSHDLYPTLLDEINVPFYARRLGVFQRANKKDVVVFSRQLSIMLKSNIPIVESLKTISQQETKQDFKEKLIKITELIKGGKSLSESLATYPKLFSSFYISMVKSGEVSGKLTDVFIYLADHLEKESNFHSKIKEAMIYPVFVLVVFLAAVSLILMYVIPKLSTVLKQNGTKLPLITKIVLSFSNFLRNNWLLVIVGIILATVILILFFKSKKWKKFFGKYSLRTPLLGSFLKKYYLSRFALNLSTLISGGIPIDKAMEITGDIVGNNEYKKIILAAKDGVEKGETISSVLLNYPNLINPIFYQMVAVGEKTGNLDSSLNNVVEFYKQEIDRELDIFIQLLEPVFIILLGIVVGGLMAAVLIPLYSIGGM